MPIIITNCKTCTMTINIRSESRKQCSVCGMCFGDVSKTRTRTEAELSDIDLSKLTKLYYKNFVVYSEKECKQFDDVTGLTTKDIITYKPSPRFGYEPHDARYSLITLFCDRMNYDHDIVQKDKDVSAFVDHGLINYSTDTKFFQSLVNRFK